MKLNREKLNELLALGDEELWREVRGIASAYGFRLPEQTPKKSDLDELRRLAKSERTPSIAEAISIVKRLGGGRR